MMVIQTQFFMYAWQPAEAILPTPYANKNFNKIKQKEFHVSAHPNIIHKTGKPWMVRSLNTQWNHIF